MFFKKKLNHENVESGDFPLKSNHPDVVFLDNACTSLKPREVIEGISSYYSEFGSCALRSVHKLGKQTTTAVDHARKKISQFVGLKKAEEVIFTRGATDSINLLCRSFQWSEGDEVIISSLEHNSNLLPWIALGEGQRVNLNIWNIDKDGRFDLKELEALLSKKESKLLSLCSDSNIIPIDLPLAEIISLAHKNDVLVHLDASQTLLHRPLNFNDLNFDFMSFSFHKILGPTGIGALCLKEEHYNKMKPTMLGGETVVNVTNKAYVLSDPPHCYEAGIGSYAEIFGAVKAIEYIEKIGYTQIQKREEELSLLMQEGLESLRKMTFLGPGLNSHLVNLYLGEMDSGELSILLDKNYNIMTRAGVHCGHYWYNQNQLSPSLRISAAFYNTESDIQRLVEALQEVSKNYL